MGLGGNVRARREQLGMTQEQLAERVPGLSQANVSALERRNSSRTDFLTGIARALLTTPEDLESGRCLQPGYLLAVTEAAAPYRVGMIEHGRPLNTGNVSEGPVIKGTVPLISWVQAGEFASVIDNLPPGDAIERVETTVPVHAHTYALRVKGDSMRNPNGDPSFPDGSVIVVEPDAISSLHDMVGQLVIMKRARDDEATFKKLVRDAGDFYLMPLNPQFSPIKIVEAADWVCCGVVREKVQRFF